MAGSRYFMFRNFILILVLILVSGCAALDPRSLFADRYPRRYLTDSYKHIVVEIITVDGMGPGPGDLDLLEDRLKKYCHKESITVNRDLHVVDQTQVPANPIWSESKLQDFRDKYKPQPTQKSDTVTLYVLFVNGRDADDDGVNLVAGLAFDPDTYVIYTERRGRTSLGSIVIHELGHILGLVNDGTPVTSDHEDGPSGGHCKNPNCAMFWMQVNDFAPDFDDACKADLKANGSK